MPSAHPIIQVCQQTAQSWSCFQSDLWFSQHKVGDSCLRFPAISNWQTLLLFYADASDLSLLDTSQVTVLGMVLEVSQEESKVTPPERQNRPLV